MRNILINLLFLGISSAVGIQAINIPSNAQTLALTSTGIAGGVDAQINPTSIFTVNPYIGFSKNTWLGGLSGQQASTRMHKYLDFVLSVESLNVNNLELWGDVPNDVPEGTFGAHWVSASATTGFKVGETGKIGIRFQSSLIRLYTDSQVATTINIGYEDLITPNLQWGVVIKNWGWLSNDDLRSHLPLKGGIGLCLNIPTIKSQIMSDFIIDSNNGEMIKIASRTQWKYINFQIGKSISENYNDISTGFSLHLASWSFQYGILFHENKFFETPQYFEIRWHY